MSSVKEFVDFNINVHKVVGFSKSYCPYCVTAREALETFKFKDGAFAWIEIEDRKDCDEIMDYLGNLTGTS
jgi:glutaredoxin 3